MSNTFKYYLNFRTTVVIMCVVAGTAEGSRTLHYRRLKGDLSMLSEMFFLRFNHKLRQRRRDLSLNWQKLATFLIGIW